MVLRSTSFSLYRARSPIENRSRRRSVAHCALIKSSCAWRSSAFIWTIATRSSGSFHEYIFNSLSVSLRAYGNRARTYNFSIMYTALSIHCQYYSKHLTNVFTKDFKRRRWMPRQPDPELEKRVLDAAQKLWRGGGDKTLSMRALAKAARTNTPAIYRRFKDRKDILRALLLRVRTKQVEGIQSAHSLEEAIDLYINFALKNPWEYELYYLQEHEQLRPAVSRSPEIGPGLDWPQNRPGQ